MSRSKNELLLIALALFVMACVAVCSLFSQPSLKAVEVDGTISQIEQTKTEFTNSGSEIKQSDSTDTYSANEPEPQTEVDAPKEIININTASVSELMTLDGIGEVKAQAIIDYREEHGGFLTTQEITSVKGIGEKTFEKIKDKICV